MWQASTLMFCVTVVVSLISAVLPALTIYMTKVIIDAVVLAIREDSGWEPVLVPLIVVALVWFTNVVFHSIRSTLQSIVSQRVYSRAALKLMNKASELDMAFFENPQSYDQLHHANRQLWKIENIAWSTMDLMLSLITLTTMFGLLSLLHPICIVILLATVIPQVYFEGKKAQIHYSFQIEFVREDRMASYMQQLLTRRDNVKEVRVFNLQKYFSQLFTNARNRYVENIKRIEIRLGAISALYSFLSNIGVFTVFVIATIQAVAQRITIGDLTMMFQAAQSASSQLRSFIANAGYLYQDSLFMTRFFEFIDMDPREVKSALAQPTKHPNVYPKPLVRGIEFRDVSFQYPVSEEPVLKGVNFTIPAGKRVAIVGENGSGKTTIIKLIARFYDPNEGAVLIDGIDAREYDLDSLRSNLSIVFQDYNRFDLTAGQNVGVGSVDDVESPSSIQAASQWSGADKFIDKLPKKYDTVLGKRFDEGVDLSGGEWQQVAISRAFMSTPQLLILDEPTAALDPLKERRLYEQIATLTENKTTVFISHRFSTVRMADVIVVIEDGRTVEVGSHHELMAEKGKYASMFLAQAERYFDTQNTNYTP